jgi:hypothetical protein
MQEKWHVGREVALRYLRARKKEKGIMLQEFCATTGYSPPYAAYLLRTYAKRVILGRRFCPPMWFRLLVLLPYLDLDVIPHACDNKRQPDEGPVSPARVTIEN